MNRMRSLIGGVNCRPALLIFLFMFSIYAMTLGMGRNGAGYSADGTFAFEMAKSAMVDPGHAYLRDQNKNFARWGVGLPTVLLPFVALAEPIALSAPQRDRIPLAEHDVLLVNFHPIGGTDGHGVKERLDLSIKSGTYDRMTLVSHSGLSAEFAQGTEIARVSLVQSSGEVTTYPIRVGVETAEWAYDRGDVRAVIQHEQPKPVARHIGNSRAYYYAATWEFDPPLDLVSAEVAYLRSTGNFYVDGLALRMVGGRWIDGPGVGRVWSERQNQEFFRRLWVPVANALITAFAAVLVFRIVRRLGYSEQVSIVIAIIYGLGTMAWPYAKYDFAEPLVTTLLLTTVWLILVFDFTNRRRYVFLAGSAIFAAVLTKYVSVIAIPVFLLAILLREGRKHGWFAGFRSSLQLQMILLAPFLLIVPAVLLVAGLVFDFRLLYERELLGGLQRGWLELPFGLGLGGLLTSWGKGVLWYNPILLLTVPVIPWFIRRHGWRSAFFIAIPIVYVLLYSRKQVWYGGNAWGPRYLVPTLPFLVVLGAPLIEHMFSCSRRRLLKVVLALTVAISVVPQLMGVSKDFTGYLDVFQQQVAGAVPLNGAIYGGADYQPWSSIQPEGDYAAVLYSYQFSPLLGHAWLLRADAVNLLAPDRTDFLADALSRTPWSRFGVDAIPRRPENGLGLDFWSMGLTESFLAYPVVLIWVAIILLGLQFLALGAWIGLTKKMFIRSRTARVMQVGAVMSFASLLIVFDTLHFML